MHERSLVLSLLRQIEEIREQHAAERVLAVRVTIGEFSGVEIDLVRTAFAELSVRSTCEGAEIQIDRVPLECKCQACGCSFVVSDFRFQCRDCECRQVEIVRGEEMILESVSLAGADHE